MLHTAIKSDRSAFLYPVNSLTMKYICIILKEYLYQREGQHKLCNWSQSLSAFVNIDVQATVSLTAVFSDVAKPYACSL